WSPTEKMDWIARFTEASQALFDATEGQLRFGHIYMTDDAWGLGHAEFVVHAFSGTAYATYGGYGNFGMSIQLFEEQRTGDPRTIVHEFGHHAFKLGDEYTGPVQTDEINQNVTPPSYEESPPVYNVVPILPSEIDSQSLQYGYAFLVFSGQIERLIVAEHSSEQVNVFSSFSLNPKSAQGSRIAYQPQYNYSYDQYPDGILIRCRGLGVQSANYCLMERYSTAPGTGVVSEFCSHDNHDPDHDTSHDARHGGMSCWEVIQQVMQDRYAHALSAPNPAVPGQQTSEAPMFFDLVKEARIALVIDRSGSMGHDNKIQGARFGIEQWINSAHQDNDWLSVIWFNETFDTRLALDQIGQGEIDAIIDQVNNVNPGGWTNIRDSLLEAVDQIQSRDGRAAVQAIVLLTDGIHNRPEGGTSIAQAIPTLQDAGIPVYVIALGTPANVDYDALEELVRETGGFINPVGKAEDQDGNPLPPDQQNSLISIHLYIMNSILRNGLVSVGDHTVAGAPPDSDFGKAVSFAGRERLTLKNLARLLGFAGLKTFVKKHNRSYSFSVPFMVEEGASTARFSITYGKSDKFLLFLMDPENNPVDFTPSSNAVLIAPDSPYATAIIRNPKPGLWHAVIVRASTGPAARVNYAAGVENRMIAVHADCDREVEPGMPVTLSAHAAWGDRLSGLRVTASLKGPDGSTHHLVLNDETREEPNSGEYRASFSPQVSGRYTGEVRIVSRGGCIYAGGIHRASHAKHNDKEPVRYDLRSKAPVFIRRLQIYFDAGKRPVPRDLDEGRKGRGDRAPVRERLKGLTPITVKKSRSAPPAKRGK
ncbi:MAG: VWA domain-containing protein, partial [Desulfatitalea sp.]|nr:VWA domain-containing protein [Desulfatitalea sp.]